MIFIYMVQKYYSPLMVSIINFFALEYYFFVSFISTQYVKTHFFRDMFTFISTFPHLLLFQVTHKDPLMI